MALEYKRATLADLDILVETRMEVLRAANRLDASADMAQVERETRAYYRSTLADGTHTAYLVFDGDLFVGAGGVSYYSVMPTYHNPTGQKAYIMNMYTRPAYRRQGIAARTLDLLVLDEVIDAMYQIGCAMPACIRETAEGGLAATPTGLAAKRRLF